jgi:putative transposase/transposase-like zinc-binding protein
MPSLQAILRAGFDAYRASVRPRFAVYHWAFSVMSCRTASLGGHVLRCPEGHVQRIQYNSCKHRACPQCAGLGTEQWLQKTHSQLLLDCDYYHVIFTVPQELNDLWQWNRVGFGNVLLGTVRDTLLELMADPQWLGATPGLMLSLHTWGRNLSVHPHVHALITGGGWTAEGWRPLRTNYLVPLAVVRALFRGKLLARVQKALRAGELLVPHGADVTHWLVLCWRLRGKKWNVRLQTRYAHGRGVLTYLARYVRGGPLKQSQLEQSDDGSIRFAYSDHRDGEKKSLRLSVVEFIRRLAEHVPEPGHRMVRYAGIYASGKRSQLLQCRQCLGMSAAGTVEYLTAAAYLERLGLGERTKCPVCGRRLVMQKLSRYVGMPPPGVMAHVA